MKPQEFKKMWTSGDSYERMKAEHTVEAILQKYLFSPDKRNEQKEKIFQLFDALTK